MKNLFFIFLISSFTYSTFATEPRKLSSIVIDTLYESKGALVIEYEVFRPFDHISLCVQSSWDQSSKSVKPVLLSGNTGKNNTSVPISLNIGQKNQFNVFLEGQQFLSLNDTLIYESSACSYGIFEKQTDHTVKQYRTQYSEKEKSLIGNQKRNMIYVDTLGRIVDTTGILVASKFSDPKIISHVKRSIDPLTIGIYEIIEMPSQNLDTINEPSRATSNYTFSISGNVRTELSSDWSTYIPETMVFLLFRNSSNPNSFYHPVSAYPSLILGTHVAKTDVSGNFSFDFSVNADLASLNINQAIILVARYNEYAYLSIAGDVLYYPAYDVPVFFENSNSTISFNPTNSSGISITDKQITVNNIVMGASLGMFWYSGKLASQLGYNLQSVTVYETNSSSYSGQFNCGLLFTQYINISSNKSISSYNLLGTPAHEFGHYLHYMMWGLANFTFSSEKTCESFAMFYSYAARHFSHKNGFGLTTPPDVNTNLALIRSEVNNFDLAPFSSPKFNGTFSYPDYAPWSSYLWELFDGHPSFQAVKSDNDDIAYPFRVIQSWNSVQNLFKTIDDFPSAFKNGLSVEEKASIDGIYNFTLGKGSNGMRSHIFNSYSVNAVSNNLIVDFTYSPYGMDTYLGNNIINNPTEFRLYRQRYTNCPWELIANIPYNSANTNYTQIISFTNASDYNYKMTVNNIAGESAYPATRNYHSNSGTCPTPNISGNYTVCTPENYNLNGLLANWSVTSGFQITTATTNVSTVTVKPTTLEGQTGTLTAKVNGVSYTKSIQACTITISGNNTNTGYVCAPVVYTLSGGLTGNWSAPVGFKITSSSSNVNSVTVEPIDFHGYYGAIKAMVNGAEATKNMYSCGISNYRYYIDNNCNGCGVCAGVCPLGAISYDYGSNKYVIDRNLCNGCMMCNIACPKKAVKLEAPDIPDGLVYIDIYSCVSCGACETECPLGAIYYDPGINVFVIDPDLCDGCLQCVNTCPVEAIRPVPTKSGSNEDENRFSMTAKSVNAEEYMEDEICCLKSAISTEACSECPGKAAQALACKGNENGVCPLATKSSSTCSGCTGEYAQPTVCKGNENGCPLAAKSSNESAVCPKQSSVMPLTPQVLDENSINFTVKYIVYPNPVTSSLHFRYESDNLNAIQTVTKGEVILINAQGRMSLRQVIQNFYDEFEVNVSALTEGTYVVCVIYDGKIVYAQNVIVQR